MGISIRRGTTKTFVLKISPFCKCPKEILDTYDELPSDLIDDNIGEIYKVLSAYDEFPENGYYEWDGIDWVYIGHDRYWDDFGTIHVRLVQGSLNIDKEFVGEHSEFLKVDYTQDDTILLNDAKPAELQVFSITGDIEDDTELALKSQTYRVSVLKSLWNGVLHNG